jgi:hypothetical protein
MTPRPGDTWHKGGITRVVLRRIGRSIVYQGRYSRPGRCHLFAWTQWTRGAVRVGRVRVGAS